MKNMLLAIAALTLLITAFRSYENYGHTLGLKSAKFKTGECVINSNRSEFSFLTGKRMIKQVGKSEYLMAHMESDMVIENWRTGESINSVDNLYQKTECGSVDVRHPQVSVKQ